jgi:hypothetical protein
VGFIILREANMMGGRIFFFNALAVMMGLALISPTAWAEADFGSTEKRSATDKTIEEKLEYQKELESLKQNNPQQYEENLRNVTLAAQMLLGQLGYGLKFNGVLDKKTKMAIREYEHSRGLPVTGDPMSMETLDTLLKENDLLEKKPIMLPALNLATDYWEDGYVSAQGTWTMANEKLAFSEHTSMIKCYRDTATCVYAIATISRDSTTFLDVDVDNYYVERWDKYEIITKPKDVACTRNVIRVNRTQKSVTLTRSSISNEGLCKNIETKEKHSTLSDGVDVYLRLSEDFQNHLDKLMKIDPTVLKILEGGVS